MVFALLIIVSIVFAFLAIRAGRLISSALWLAGTSALLSILFYMLGAALISVIELSVGAGLVTVLFVFAISVAGEDAMDLRPIVPKVVAVGSTFLALALLAGLIPANPLPSRLVIEPALSTVMWQERGLDILIQIVLIFAGVLGLLGLLEEAKAPLKYPVAEQVAAKRERELEEMGAQVLEEEAV
jgi:NADH:ubiquinone oxidoreductase subunit 6 (subunit J)